MVDPMQPHHRPYYIICSRVCIWGGRQHSLSNHGSYNYLMLVILLRNYEWVFKFYILPSMRISFAPDCWQSELVGKCASAKTEMRIEIEQSTQQRCGWKAFQTYNAHDYLLFCWRMPAKSGGGGASRLHVLGRKNMVMKEEISASWNNEHWRFISNMRTC